MSLLALQFDPHKCPCCWDVQGTNLSDWDTLIYSTATGPCHALCMPFVSDAPDWLAYDDVTCRLQAVLSGVSPSFTPCKSTTWLESDSGVYWSKILTNGTCQAQYAQYCIVDEEGFRGRSWVVELWIKDGVGSITNFNTTIRDWDCKCADGNGGAGARFEWTLDIEVPAACTPEPPACNCDHTCLTFSYASTTLNPVLGSSCVVAGRTVTMTGGPDGCLWSEGSFPPSNLTGGAAVPFDLQVAFRGTGCTGLPIYRRARADGCIGVYTLQNNMGITSGLPATITVSACP